MIIQYFFSMIGWKPALSSVTQPLSMIPPWQRTQTCYKVKANDINQAQQKETKGNLVLEKGNLLTIREFFQDIDDVTFVKRELVGLLSSVVVKSVHLGAVCKQI